MKTIIKKLLLFSLIIPFTACASTTEAAQKAVEEYNLEQQTYMEAIKEYNTSAKERNEDIQKLTAEINASQESINKEEIPFDPETLKTLKDEMIKAQELIVPEVEVLPEFEPLTVDENADDESLKALTNQAKADLKTMKSVTIPDPVEKINLSENIESLTKAHQNYKDSIQSLKQITAPEDSFVMDRLKRIEYITAIGAVTEDNDPNGNLNKAGGYIGTIYYTDTRVDRSKLYLGDGDDVISVGTEGGGAIEIYPNVEDAKKRDSYLSAFDGSIMSNGSHHVYGTLVIRVSDELKASTQNEMTEQIVKVLTEID